MLSKAESGSVDELMDALMEDELKILMRRTHVQAVAHVQQAEESDKEKERLQEHLARLWRQYEAAVDSGLSPAFHRNIMLDIEDVDIAIEKHLFGLRSR